MNQKAFWDTCLAIAFVFHINSLHSQSHNVFDLYGEHYWSEFVKNEYEKRFDQKFKNLSRFFHDLDISLESPTQDLYSANDLIHFALKYSDRLRDDAKNSVEPFWNEYVGIQSRIPFFDLKTIISNCLIDLNHDKVVNDSLLKQELKLTPQRTKEYNDINLMLKSNGVDGNDRHVVLDGHDFAKYSADPVDFITFDETVYYGAKNVKILSFDSIKGKYDFNAS